MNTFAILSRRELLRAGTGLLTAAASSLWWAGRAQGEATLSKSTLITEPYVVVETANGKLRGGHSRGALAFKGIPYGGSGVGRKPLQARAARGTPGRAFATPWRSARPHRNRRRRSTANASRTPGEECLVLNVWTPAIDGKKRPVLFYNHGGGFSTGSAGSVAQDGGQLAANHDVVVVASNHRLGIMGYLCLDEFGGDGLRRLRQCRHARHRRRAQVGT